MLKKCYNCREPFEATDKEIMCEVCHAEGAVIKAPGILGVSDGPMSGCNEVRFDRVNLNVEIPRTCRKLEEKGLLKNNPQLSRLVEQKYKWIKENPQQKVDYGKVSRYDS